MLWKSGLKNWVKAENVKGLFDTPTITPPPLPQIPPQIKKRVQIQTREAGKGDEDLSVPSPQQNEKLPLEILSNLAAEKNPDHIKAKSLKTFINRRTFLFILVAVILMAAIPLWKPLLGTLSQTPAPSRAPSPVKIIESEWGPPEALGEALAKEAPQDKGEKPAAKGAAIKEWEPLTDEVMLIEVMSLYRQGNYDRAVVVAKKVLQVAEQVWGPNHPSVAKSLNNLAELYYTQGQYAQAEPLFKRSLAILEKALGPDHPFVATSLENMALFYRKTGREKAAEELEKRAAAILAIKR